MHRLLLACGVLVISTLMVGAAGQHGRDPAAVAAVVHGVSGTIASEYFDASIAARASARLEAERQAGHYNLAATDDDLAAAMSRDLFDVTRDKHLMVAAVHHDAAAPGSSASSESRPARGLRDHFGVRQSAILDGRVGYLDVTSFYRADEARDAIASAMSALAPAGALIVDLRENGGGAPDTVALLAGYLLDTPGRPLFEIVPRSGERRLYSTPDPPVSPRNGSRPVYVLTSSRTFSAGEGLAFLLQELRRAIIVGERTAGAANPGRPYPVGTDFEVTVPNGRVRTVASGRNWEGTGVMPDVNVPAASALDRALQLARR